MAGPLVRRSVWGLEQEQAWHPVIRAYARAVGEMQRRPATDPTSWTYQAAVHDVPRGEPKDQWRAQCQHASWFFLPWHRLYLSWFERIVRSIVQTFDDLPPDTRQTWALPYWNYSVGSPGDTLPEPFRAQTWPGTGDANPLFVAQRADYINAGDPLPAEAVSVSEAMRETAFSEQPLLGLPAGFGGSRTQWHHGNEPGGVPGQLEMTPHGDVHTEVGGEGGFMSAFATAPLDPIFWLHHCNLDRLWEAWRLQPNRSNPNDAQWASGVTFHFHDERGSDVIGTSGGAVDTVADFGYTYDDVVLAPVALMRRGAPTPPIPPRGDRRPEMVGTTADSVTLAGGPERLAFGYQMPASLDANRRRRAEPEAPPARVYLNIDNVEGERNPGIAYGVYLNLPDDADLNGDIEDYRVGNLNFFGIEATSDLDRAHVGGLRFVFDVTDTVDALQAEGRWGDTIEVAFVPLRRAQAAAASEAPPVHVGGVSLFLH